MDIVGTNFDSLTILEPKVFTDPRGYFYESFSQKVFEKQTGIKTVFVQDNQSKSSYGTLRGLHFQTGDSAQAKLVRVLSGKVLDVAVDLRPGSLTFKKHFAVELSDENKKQLFVPRGFAHGFVVLSETAEFFYKCDNYYDPKNEGGIRFDDKDLNINWGIAHNQPIISEKDRKLPGLKEYLQSL